MIFEVPEVKNQSKIGPETASSKNRAARASWKALGVDFGGLWGPFGDLKSVRKGVDENDLLFTWFSRGSKGGRVFRGEAPLGLSRTAGEG